MTAYELSLVERAARHALDIGAPGLSDAIKIGIVNSIARRLAHQLNIVRQPDEAPL